MRKAQLYGKTRRVEDKRVMYYLYEKIDGCNLGIAKIGNELIIVQRNNIINNFDEITYGGLKGWVNNHKEALLQIMNNNTIIFGEWLEKDKYQVGVRFFHFASAQIKEGTTFDNLCIERIGDLNYNGKEYGFENDLDWDNRGEIYNYINFISPVPLINVRNLPFTHYDDIYYNIMRGKSVLNKETICEGFVMVDYDNKPLKVVYAKNGKYKKITAINGDGSVPRETR